MEKHKINLPIIVEGKYDKIKLSSLVDADIITLDGFAVFNSGAKQSLIRRLGQGGIILFTDPDGAGKALRSFISGILPKDKIYQVYIPKIEGKEKRKTKPSKAGYLGVEGVDKEHILKALSPFIKENTDGKGVPKRGGITKLDFYNAGLFGKDNSTQLRARFCSLCDLPNDLSANALLSAVNIIMDKEEYEKLIEKM